MERPRTAATRKLLDTRSVNSISMSNGVSRASVRPGRRIVRELGSRAARTYAAIEGLRSMVVVQHFGAGNPKAGVTSQHELATAHENDSLAHVLRCARALAKHWHPNIARIRTVDLEGDDVVVTSDFIDGVTLADLFAASSSAGAPTLPFPVVGRIVVDVLAGLTALHGLRDEAGVLGAIHGEICPENIVIGRDGVARLVNSARPGPIARRTKSEGLRYAAPETLDGAGASDLRADVYSVGVILWEALSGRRLYDESDPARLVARQRAEDIHTPLSDATTGFAPFGEIAMHAVAFDPALRYRTAVEMATMLRRLDARLIAPGSVVAATVTELAGDRIRVRRAEIDPAASVGRGYAASSKPPCPPVLAAPVSEVVLRADERSRPPPLPPRASRPAPPSPAVVAIDAPDRSAPERVTMPGDERVSSPDVESPASQVGHPGHSAAPDPFLAALAGPADPQTSEPPAVVASSEPAPTKARARAAMKVALAVSAIVLCTLTIRALTGSSTAPSPTSPSALATSNAAEERRGMQRTLPNRPRANGNANAQANASANVDPAAESARGVASASASAAASVAPFDVPPPSPAAPVFVAPPTTKKVYDPHGI